MITENLNGDFTRDPRGEYTRSCPYCRESFLADHLSRRYCPSKHGKVNYCKNRHRRLVEAVRKGGGLVLEHPKSPVRVYVEAPAVLPNNIDTLAAQSQRAINCAVLSDVLTGKSYLEMTAEALAEQGFDTTCFDSVEQPKSGPDIFLLDRFVFVNRLENLYYLTTKKALYGTA
jgi:ABC-type nitrate/sulfonate/bicarbonate transport system substrate-binding protein